MMTWSPIWTRGENRRPGVNRRPCRYVPLRHSVGEAAREHTVTNKTTRRDIVKGSLALAGLGIVGMPEWAVPALAQAEELVPFTDVPETFGHAGRLAP